MSIKMTVISNFFRNTLVTLTFVSAISFLLVGCQAELPAGVLLQDDFSNARTGWQISEDIDGYLTYLEDKYVIRAESRRLLLWGQSNSGPYENVGVTVSAEYKSDARELGFGVLCNYQDPNNTYLFEISPAGGYIVALIHNGEQTVLDAQDTSSAIPLFADLYTIEVTCAGGSLGLRVDGNDVTTLQDDTLAQGDIGLFVHSYARGGIEVHFDDIEVRDLNWSDR